MISKQQVAKHSGSLLVFALTMSILVVNMVLAQTVSFDLTICFSAVAGLSTQVAVQSPPSDPVDVLTIPGTHSKYEITCVKVFEQGPVLAASQVGLCETPALIYICYAFESTPTAWQCTPYQAYQADPQTHVTIGGQGDEPKHIKVQWEPQNSGVLCFPRDLTVQVVGKEIVPEQHNVVANIVFIVIVVAVCALVGFFGLYQGRKVMRKFWKKQKARPATHMTENEHNNTLKALGGDQSPKRSAATPKRGTLPGDGDEAGSPATRGGIPMNNIYQDDPKVHYASGAQYAYIEGGAMEVRSHPMPKPWYQRHNYDGSKREQQQQQAGDPEDERVYNTAANTNGGGYNSRNDPYSAPGSGSRDLPPNGSTNDRERVGANNYYGSSKVESIQRYDNNGNNNGGGLYGVSSPYGSSSGAFATNNNPPPSGGNFARGSSRQSGYLDNSGGGGGTGPRTGSFPPTYRSGGGSATYDIDY